MKYNYLDNFYFGMALKTKSIAYSNYLKYKKLRDAQ